MNDFYRKTPDEQAEIMRGFARAALRRWNIAEAELSLVKMRENVVFRVDPPGGPRYALRIHRHNYHSDRELQSELEWMNALEEAGVEVPLIVTSAGGRRFEIVEQVPVPEPRQVDLFEWINGRQLGETGEALAGDEAAVKRTFFTLGELCARVHNQSSTWTLPEGFRRHAWDEEGLTGETPLWGRFWELAALTDAQRRLISRARSRVHEELSAALKPREEYGIIHADLTPENVLVDGERLRLIDFDDAGFGWYLFEIATALYFHQPEPYFESARDAMIEGYRRHRALSDEAVARLPLFFMARAFTYLGWVHTREETQTAQELTPALVEMACAQTEDYLAR